MLIMGVYGAAQNDVVDGDCPERTIPEFSCRTGTIDTYVDDRVCSGRHRWRASPSDVDDGDYSERYWLRELSQSPPVEQFG